jgi:catechol 2,3-dioxygenase-like lactoylglutathione lyase family enzyme
MKTSIYLAITLILIAVTAAIGDDQKSPRPQGMTLRLELFVTDMQKSIDFYTNVLGFERMKGDPDYAPVRSGSVLIALGPAAGLPEKHHFNPEVQNSRRGLGVEIVLEVDDVKSFFEKVKATGYKGVLSPPRRQSWGATDFRIADPDGYYLRITSR